MLRLAVLLMLVAALGGAEAQTATANLFGSGAAVANGDDNGDGVFLVDKDEVQCPDAEFNSIQEAVTAAAPGSTVAVCPDLYNEDVTVPKTLTLRAVNAFDDEDDGDDDFDDGKPNCFSPSVADPTRQAIVDGAVLAFALQANDIVLEGFVIQGNTTGITTSRDFSGYRIRHNLVQDNPVGLGFQSNGARPSLVEQNCFRSTSSPPLTLGEADAGILSFGDLQNATIQDNSFLRHFISGILLTHTEGAHFRNITISKNRSFEDVCAVSIQGSRSSRIVGNLSIRNGFAGIFVASDNQFLAVRSNFLREGEHGIDFDSFNFNNGNLAPNLFVVASGNRISNMNRTGIAVSESVLGSLQRSLISGNTSTNNAEDGIRIEGCTPTGGGPPCPTPNVDNIISSNFMRGNAEHDCHDDTIGTGTAGTGNVWRNNRGVTESRPGLCDADDGNSDD